MHQPYQQHNRICSYGTCKKIVPHTKLTNGPVFCSDEHRASYSALNNVTYIVTYSGWEVTDAIAEHLGEVVD
jgi:hypothetical protein